MITKIPKLSLRGGGVQKLKPIMEQVRSYAIDATGLIKYDREEVHDDSSSVPSLPSLPDPSQGAS